MTSNETHAALSKAFRFLASIEGVEPCDCPRFSSVSGVRSRVTTLAALFGLLPYSQTMKVDQLANHWNVQFANDETVPATCLQRSAREWLERSAEGTQDTNVDVQQVERWLAIEGDSVAGDSGMASSQAFSLVAKQTCAKALLKWQTRLLEDPQWTKVGGMTPLDEPVSLEHVYTDLYLCPRTTQHLETRRPMTVRHGAGRVCSGRNPAVAIDWAISGMSRNCLVLGEPGSGKSTMVQWLAWATRRHRLPSFELAIAVSLRDFVAELQANSRLGILEFFIASQLDTADECKSAANCLRAAAERSNRFLLLIDGWDEVPSHLRRAVEAAIRRDSDTFVTVVTSRLSGLPWQIFDNTEVYEIAGLEQFAIRKFVGKRIKSQGNTDREAERVIDKIEAVPDLLGMASNPFLLGMLTRLLSGSSRTVGALSRAEIFQQITSWMTDQNKLTWEGQLQIGPHHLRSLENLAYQMSIAEPNPRYVFNDEEIELDVALPNALEQSRFVHRVSGLMNNWAFLCPALQEFFAARKLARQTGDRLDQDWDRLLFSQSRLATLELFAGLNNSVSQYSAKRAMEKLRSPDRFGLLTARLARVAAAAKWNVRHVEVHQAVAEELWLLIVREQDSKATDYFVRELAKLDADFLCQKVAEKKRVNQTVQEAIVECLPPQTITAGQLLPRLTTELRKRVLAKTSANHERNVVASAISQLRAKRVPKDAPVADVPEALLKELLRHYDTDDSSRLLESLAAVFMNLSDRDVLRILTDEFLISDPTLERLRQLAIEAFTDGGDGPRRMSPVCRNRLLRRLAILGHDDSRVEAILKALDKYPIREGGELIASIALDRQASTRQREAACRVLRTVSGQSLIQSVVDAIACEPDADVATSLLKLASDCSVQLPTRWLEKRIISYDESVPNPMLRGVGLKEFVATYLGNASSQDHKDRERCRQFIEPWFKHALLGDSLAPQELGHDARELSLALRMLSESDNVIAWSDTMVHHARAVLKQVIVGDDLSLGQMRLAFQLAGVGPDAGQIGKSLLDSLLERKRRCKDPRQAVELELFAKHVAESLAKLSLATLLPYPAKVSCVGTVLQDLAMEHGMLIYPTRALDLDGRCVVDLNDDFITNICPDDMPAIRNQTLNSLPPMQHRAVKSFQIATEYLGPQATYEEIHSSIDDGAHLFPVAIREDLDELYHGVNFPRLTAWRRSLNHATRKLGCSVDGQHLLSELRLPRR